MPLNLNNNEVTGVDLNNTEVSEVRLNGQTVFTSVSSGVAASGTVLAQYRIDQNSGLTVADDTGNEFSFSVSGASLVTDTDLIDDRGLDFDGSNDELTSSSTFSFNNFGQLTDEFSMMMTVEFDTVATDQTLFASGPSGRNGTFDRLGFGVDINNSGVLSFVAEGDNGNNSTKAGISGLTSNTKHRVGFRLDAGVVGEVILDKSIGTTDGNTRRDAINGTYIGSRDGIFHADCNIDNIVFYDGIIGSTVIQEDFDAQPWTP